MPRTVDPEDRKVPWAVSLSARQQRAFKAAGGSQWLQAQMDKRIERERLQQLADHFEKTERKTA